ncbi:unnamed protein product [Cuscuta epithymum]|uniref:Uncharacterized protein n=1 Tax=Cuscuta epithymum TaxID=186058 RepID=A0AAV0CT31_9ASTE|nr:unnamed protein product [Cuscuta epithymum]
MVGVFSRFSSSNKAAHRRSRSAIIDERTELPPRSSEVAACGGSAVAAGVDVVATATTHSIERAAVEFKPIEHPNEPLINEAPVQCPFPELPVILYEGKIRKEHIHGGGRIDFPVTKEGDEVILEAQILPKCKTHANRRQILPSLSAPEHIILSLLDESLV